MTEENLESKSSLIHRIGEIARPSLKFVNDDSPIPAHANLGEFGLDSLGSIDLLSNLESEFDFEIPDDLLDENTFSSLSHLETLVKTVLESQSKSGTG